MSAEPPAIDCRGLSVTIHDRQILHALDLQIDSGIICGLLGANGSGKTTLLKALAGQIPHDGAVRWLGKPSRDPGVTAVSLQSSGYHPKRTVRDHLTFLRLTGGVDEEALTVLVDQLGLGTALGKKPSTMSFGQRQALNILGSLACQAQIYLLDEPFAGLDAKRVSVVRGRMLELQARGATVVITSHDLAPIEDLLQRLVVLEQGALHFAGRTEEFVSDADDTVVRIVCSDGYALGRFLASSSLSMTVLSVTRDSLAVAHSDYRDVVVAAMAAPVDVAEITISSSRLRTALADRLDSYREERPTEVVRS